MDITSSKSEPIFTLKISAAFLILVALAWSWLYQPFLPPFPFPTILKTALMAGLVVFLMRLYRLVRFEYEFKLSDIFAWVGYFLSFVVLNFPMLTESITGDELYNAERSVYYLNFYRHLPQSLQSISFLQNTPLPELNFYFSMLIIAVLAGAYFLYKTFFIPQKAKAKYILGFITLTLLGYAFSLLPFAAEPHPPMRLLPLFVSQMFLGLGDFAFRFPSILTAALVSFVVYHLMLKTAVRPLFAWATGFFCFMVPTVFHVSAIVEPSIWAYATAVLSLACLYVALRENDDNYFILAGLIIGLGTLFRQTAIILWPMLLIFALMRKKFNRQVLLAFIPALFLVPYLLTVVKLGHPAVNIQNLKNNSISAEQSINQNKTDDKTARNLSEKILAIPPVKNLINSFTTGIGPNTILKSSTLPWLLFLALAMLWVFLRSKLPLKPYFLILPLGYVLFHIIGPGLWGLGRYQAEFIAPAIVCAILVLATELPEKYRSIILTLFFLSAYSFFTNQTIPQDIHYNRWNEKRISTETHFPYKEALGFIQRQDTEGKFVIVGGVPLWGDLHLWMRGFTYKEVEYYNARREKYTQFIQNNGKLADFYKFLQDNDIDYFLVQYADKREVQHRTQNVSNLLSELSATQNKAPYSLTQTFIGRIGGAIDIYAREPLRY